MTVRVGINGFGRMGRLALRAAHGNGDFEVVHLNEVKGGPATAAHLLEFDSVHGRWPVPVGADGDTVPIAGRRLSFSEHGSPREIPWSELGVDVVIESSGKFVTAESLQAWCSSWPRWQCRGSCSPRSCVASTACGYVRRRSRHEEPER